MERAAFVDNGDNWGRSDRSESSRDGCGCCRVGISAGGSCGWRIMRGQALQLWNVINADAIGCWEGSGIGNMDGAEDDCQHNSQPSESEQVDFGSAAGKHGKLLDTKLTSRLLTGTHLGLLALNHPRGSELFLLAVQFHT